MIPLKMFIVNVNVLLSYVVQLNRLSNKNNFLLDFVRRYCITINNIDFLCTWIHASITSYTYSQRNLYSPIQIRMSKNKSREKFNRKIRIDCWHTRKSHTSFWYVGEVFFCYSSQSQRKSGNKENIFQISAFITSYVSIEKLDVLALFSCAMYYAKCLTRTIEIHYQIFRNIRYSMLVGTKYLCKVEILLFIILTQYRK